MATLMEWSFIKGNHYHLRGIVSGHPKLAEGMDITTSPVKMMERQDNNLIARTESGTLYYLKLSDMNMEDYVIKDTKTALKSFGFDESIISEAEMLIKQRDTKWLKAADRIIGNNELLLIMYGTSTMKAYFKSNNKVELCNVGVHLGMFQDSVLIRLFDKVDFRYFPNIPCEVYHWSDGLIDVKIKNAGTEDIVFGKLHKRLCIKKDEIKSLDKNIFANEGLFSPDCVNGKSILNQ